MSDLISRKELLKTLGNYHANVVLRRAGLPDWNNTTNEIRNVFQAHGQEVKEIIEAAPAVEINGDTSDGYHTFNELYHHRAVLFSVIVKAFHDKAWKSKMHHDGTMYDGMFIVGIETPNGQATYHYDVEPYWDMFKCRELEHAPEWDGHTPQEAINRIGGLEPVLHGEWYWREEVTYNPTEPTEYNSYWACSACGKDIADYLDRAIPGSFIFLDSPDYEPIMEYCPHCGAKMDVEDERKRT